MADTGSIIALIDADDRHHETLRTLYESDPDAWILPWAILPEVDYLLATRVDTRAEIAFMADLADGRFTVDWGAPADLARAHQLQTRYAALALGLVDTVVMAQAERLRADAIATLDLRHFAAVQLHGDPFLLPRDM